LHCGSGYRIGEFRCPPGSTDWRRENWIGDRAHVVFPGPAVGILQEGRAPLVATPNEAVLYNGATTYRRTMISPDGDHSVFVELGPSLSAETGAFATTWVPVGVDVYAFHRLLARTAAVTDPLDVDEHVYAFVRRISSASGRRVRAGAADAVEHVKAIISLRLRERLTLAELAVEVHYSPFHLARVFRAVTGVSICYYRTQIRVRHAIERVLDPSVPIAEIAVDLGFASHAHLTTVFHRAVGARPVDVRRLGRQAVGQVRTT
jgi:AraC-like DNA-binding protein